jgi:hypothetical protein
MSAVLGSHVSIHLLRFAEPRTRNEIVDFAIGEKTDDFDVVAVELPVGADVLKERVGPVWGVVGRHANAEIADQAVTDASTLSPTVEQASESWHASFDVVGHHGATNWVDQENPGPTFAPMGGHQNGPLAVVTTAGFIVDENFDLARATDFSVNVGLIVPVLAAAPGNAIATSFVTVLSSGIDGFTFSIWRDTGAMRDATYRPGLHREQLDRYRSDHTADRTSFTRLRPRLTKGTWGGVDLIEAALAS